MIDCSSIFDGLVLPEATAIRRHPTMESWLRSRPKGLGASEAPKVLGLSPYGGPWSVWARKCLPFEYSAPTATQQRGHREEARILEDYAALTGHRVEGPLGHLVITGPRPWMRETPDSLIFDGDTWGQGEVKTDRSDLRVCWGRSGQHFGDWSEAEGEVREDYATQLYYQLACTGLPWGLLIVRLSMDDLRWYRLDRDLEVEAWMLEQLQDFWDLVSRRRSGDVHARPPIDDSTGCTKALARMLGDSAPGEVAAATQGQIALVRRWRAMTKLLEGQTERVQQLKNEVSDSICEAGLYGIEADDWKVLYQKGSGSSRFPRYYPRRSK